VIQKPTATERGLAEQATFRNSRQAATVGLWREPRPPSALGRWGLGALQAGPTKAADPGRRKGLHSAARASPSGPELTSSQPEGRQTCGILIAKSTARTEHRHRRGGQPASPHHASLGGREGASSGPRGGTLGGDRSNPAVPPRLGEGPASHMRRRIHQGSARAARRSR